MPPILVTPTRLLALAILLAAASAAAQEAEAPPAPVEEAKPVEADFSKPMGPPDPYNRGTPRGSMYGFLMSAARA